MHFFDKKPIIFISLLAILLVAVVLHLQSVLFLSGNQWLGDWITVFAFIPLIIILALILQRRAHISQGLLLPVCFGMSVSFFVFIVLWQSETQWINIEFYNNADEMAEVATKTIEAISYEHDNLAALMTNSEYVSLKEFNSFFAEELARRQRSTHSQSIFWVPIIPAGERTTFESLAAYEGLAGFKITERGASGETIQAADRDDYFPVFYSVSFDRTEYFKPGFDLGSDVLWRAALEKAQTTGSLVVINPVGAMSEKPERGKIATIRPVFRLADGPAEKSGQESILGFVVSVYQLNDLINTSISPFSHWGLDTYLFNLNRPVENQLVFSLTWNGSFDASDNIRHAVLEKGLYRSTNFLLGDHTLLLVIRPATGWVTSQRSLIPWLSLFMGIFITLAFAARHQYIERVSRMEQENRTRMDLAMESARIGYWDYDPISERLFSSAGFEIILKVARGSIRSIDDIYKYIHPDDMVRVSQVIDAVKRGNSLLPLTARVIRSDGIVRWITLNGYAQYNARGKGTHTVGIIQDITESKQIEEKIRISEERYRRLVELSPDVILIEVDEKLAFINRAGLRLLGAENIEEIIGRPILDFIPNDNQETLKEWILKVHMGKAGSNQLESKIVDLQGKLVEVEVVATQFFYMDQFGALFLLRDISERKQAEAATRFQIELLDSIRDAIISVDNNKVITSWNLGAEAIYGWRPEEVLGKRLETFLTTEYLEKSYQQALQEAVESGNYRGIVQQKRKDGTNVIIESSVRALLDLEGNVTGFLGVNRDITERRKAETELREQKEILQKIFDHIPLMIDLVTTDGKIKLVNREWEQKTGWTLEEIQRDDLNVFAELYPDEKEYNRVLQFLTTKQLEWIDFKTRVRDGRILDTSWMEVKLSDGTIIGIGQDITERKQAEAELMEMEESLRLAVRSANICLWDWNLKTGEVYFSPEWHALLGYSENELTNDLATWKSNLHPDDFEQTIKTVEAYLANPCPNIEIGFRLRHKDGTYRSVFAQATLKYNETGDPIRMMGTSIDVTKWEQAEEALRLSEERFRLLAENAHDIVFQYKLAPENKFTYISPAVTCITGYSPAELYADPSLLNHIIGDYCWNFLSSWERAKYLVDQPATVRLNKKDGQFVWVEISSVPFFDQEGKLITLEGIARDITDRREAERIEQIQSSVTCIFNDAEGVDKALEHVMQLIALELDWDVSELWWLETGDAHLTMKSEWHKPSKEFDILKSQSQHLKFAEGEGLQGRAWREARSLWIVDTIEHPDGVKFLRSGNLKTAGLHSGIAMPIINNEKVLGVITFFSRLDQPFNQHIVNLLADVGHQIGQFIARKQAEHSLAQAEQMYRMMFEEAPIMYVIIRDLGKGPEIHDCNHLFQKTMQYERKDLIGRKWEEFMTPDSRGKMHTGFQLNIKTGKNISQERELITKDGRIILTMLHAVPEFDHNGTIIGTRCMYVDITERKTMEQALKAERAQLAVRVEERTAELSLLNAQLRRANRAKDEFLANMSHELRTPLNGILAFTEALIDQTRGPLNERQLKAMNSIDSSGRHLLSLINDVLDLSKIEAGKLEVQMEKVSIDDVCHASLIFIKETANKKQIKVHYHNQETDLYIHADPRRLKQILVNLLGNAVKFTPAGGEIYLGIEMDSADGILSIIVRDTGIGISKEDQQNLFQPFSQIDSSLTRTQEGSGLGLVLVHKLVELHGGGVKLESEPEKGSSFTVLLPLSNYKADLSMNELIEGDSVLDFRSTECRRRVLLVEDNEINIEAIGEYLTDVGYKVFIARNGKEAIDQIHEWNPEIILMDIQMPVMNGLETIAHLRTDQKFMKTPIIALTALAMAGDREYCLQNGATEYLSKPVSLKNLVRMIEQLTAPADYIL